MHARDFEKLVEDALAQVPPRFRRHMRNIVVVVEDEPPRPGLLGLYQGYPLTARSVSMPISQPDRITIYQGPHERAARTPQALRDLVAETVFHEIGHYFGMDEAQVRRSERRRAATRRRL